MKKILCFALLFLLVGCSAPRAVMQVDGYDISAELYRYYFQSMKDEYADEATAKSEAVEQLRSHVAVIRFAERYGVSLTQEELDEIETQIKSSKARNDNFTELLAQSHLTEDSYRELCRHDALRQKLMQVLFDGAYAMDEAAMRAVIEQEFICARHIFFDANADGAAEAAEQVMQELAEGASFDALFTEYMGQDYSEEPYLFGKGYMVEEFDAAARALEIGQVSGLVSTGYGYHFIERLPLDWDYINENLATITEEYMQARIANDMAAQAAGYAVVELE